jgi:hypothetical protein
VITFASTVFGLGRIRRGGSALWETGTPQK